jgi:hypothetical protein
MRQELYRPSSRGAAADGGVRTRRGDLPVRCGPLGSPGGRRGPGGRVAADQDGATLAVRGVWTDNEDHAAWLVATQAGLPVESVTVWAGDKD